MVIDYYSNEESRQCGGEEGRSLLHITEFACLFVCLVVFKATFNNSSVISWRSVLLKEETGVPGENHRTAASY